MITRIKAAIAYYRARRALHHHLVLYLKARDAHGPSRERLNEARYYAGVMRRARVTMRTGEEHIGTVNLQDAKAAIQEWHRTNGVTA